MIAGMTVHISPDQIAGTLTDDEVAADLQQMLTDALLQRGIVGHVSVFDVDSSDAVVEA